MEFVFYTNWDIEGSIETQYKIDISFFSLIVNIASRLHGAALAIIPAIIIIKSVKILAVTVYTAVPGKSGGI